MRDLLHSYTYSKLMSNYLVDKIRNKNEKFTKLTEIKDK